MQDVDQRLTRDVDRLCTDLAELIPTMVSSPAVTHAMPFLLFSMCLHGCQHISRSVRS